MGAKKWQWDEKTETGKYVDDPDANPGDIGGPRTDLEGMRKSKREKQGKGKRMQGDARKKRKTLVEGLSKVAEKTRKDKD